MGIKSTTTLHRWQALEMYHDLRQKLYGEQPNLSNHELGDSLDKMSDEWADRNNTTCFDNFFVVDDGEPIDQDD